MKVRIAVLAGAGAASGLVMALAGPAGAAATTAAYGYGGYYGSGGYGGYGASPPPACTTYSLVGEITTGEDAGTEISGTLCVPDSPLIGVVTGSVEAGKSRILDGETMSASTSALPEAAIPVKGFVFERRAIDFAGSEEVSPVQAQTEALARASTRPVFEFDESQGQAVARKAIGVSPDTAVVGQSPSYAGTFRGLRAEDEGTWSAVPETDTPPPAASH